MSPPRATATATALASALLLPPIALSGPPAAGAPATSVDPTAGQASAPASQVITDWQRTAIRTIYAEQTPPTPPPIGVPYLGFTSLVILDAVDTARQRGGASAKAAVAVAAHDVLLEYFPASGTNLAADLATSLDQVPPSRAKAKGRRIGARAAADLIADRADDGRNDPSIVYSRPEAPGVWQPPATGMLGAWLGFTDLLVLDDVLEVDGPDPLTSTAYATDYDEVRRLGSTTSTERTAYQSETATFFNFSVPVMLSTALVEHQEANPLPLRRTALLFARAHAAATDSIIQTWRLKYDVGFWRPFQAIAGAADDGNPATVPETGWAPFIPNPPYSDYTSGHASFTAPVVAVMRRMLGEDTSLTLRAPALNLVRTYPNLSSVEVDALMARIWGGLHYRDAMEDGYDLGHRTARQVMRHLR